jgi:hypothetical protein
MALGLGGAVIAPASTCGYCGREGVVSLDQTSHSGNSVVTSQAPLGKRMRFHCTCGWEWLADAAEAEAHGAWLDQARLR